MDYTTEENIPLTCAYWQSSKCFKGERCTFLHGYVCCNDGFCQTDVCSDHHFKQPNSSQAKDSKILQQNQDSTKISRESRSEIPFDYDEIRIQSSQIDVLDHSNSVEQDHSSKRLDNYSTRRPDRYFPHRKDNSSKRSDYSPETRSSRYSSRRTGRSSPKRSRHYSPDRRGYSPRRQRHRSRSRSRSRSRERRYHKSNYPSTKAVVDDNVDRGKSHSVPDLVDDEHPKIIEIGDEFKLPPVEPTKLNTKEGTVQISKVAEDSAASDCSADTVNALELIKSLPDTFFGINVENTKKKPEDKHESFRNAFLKALSEGGKNTDNNVSEDPLNAKSLAKPFQDKLYDYQPWKSFGSTEEEPVLKFDELPEVSSSKFDLESPYIDRNLRRHIEKSKEAVFIAPPSPPSFKSSGVKNAEGKLKLSKIKDDSASKSESKDDSASKKDSTSKNDPPLNSDALLEKKKKILTKVWSLMEQKKKLEAQRDTVILNHKGDSQSLATLLKENDELSFEIDRQVFTMNNIIKDVNCQLGVSKEESQLQTFSSLPVAKMMKPIKNVSSVISADPKVKEIKKKFRKPEDENAVESPAKVSKTDPSEQKSKSKNKEEEADSRAKEKEKSSKLSKDKKDSREKDKNKKSKPSSIKYIDQGMHWCDVCNEFNDSIGGYLRHLQSVSHMTAVQNVAKPWLPKPPPIPKKSYCDESELVTIPLQGIEFLHSVTTFFCSLCKVFIHSLEEARSHSETNEHANEYKDHLSSNPLYETMYVKKKMSAYASYTIAKKTSKEKKGDVNENSTKNESKDERSSSVVKMSDSSANSIRVASRQKKSETSEISKEADKYLPPSHVDDVNITNEDISNGSTFRKKENSSKLIRKETATSPSEKSSSETSKVNIKRISSVFIGKMPFLKKTSKLPLKPKPKETAESNSCEISEAEKRIKQLVSQGFKLKPSDFEKETSSTRLPASVPRNSEYITEIESGDKGVKFTKVIGPTLQPDEPDDEEEREMDISDSDASDEENSNGAALHRIPIPLQPISNVKHQSQIPLPTTPNLRIPPPRIPVPPVPTQHSLPSMDAIPLPSLPQHMPNYGPNHIPVSQNITNIGHFSNFCDVSHPNPPEGNPTYRNFVPPPPPGTEVEIQESPMAPESDLCERERTPPPPGTEYTTNVSKKNDDESTEDLSMLLQDLPVKPRSDSETECNSDVNNEGLKDSLVKEEIHDGEQVSLVKEEIDDDELPDPLVNIEADDGLQNSIIKKEVEDEEFQDSLVQEGLDLLEFADEDDE